MLIYEYDFLAKEMVERMYGNLEYFAFCEIFEQFCEIVHIIIRNYVSIVFFFEKLEKKCLIELFCIFIFDKIRWQSWRFHVFSVFITHSQIQFIYILCVDNV